MLTCKTPPQSTPSPQPVKLTIDSVKVEAPVQYSYKNDPLISSVQPTRSFIRWANNIQHRHPHMHTLTPTHTPYPLVT